MSQSLAAYRTALSTPGTRGPVLASLLARLPIAMIGISALLYVQRETGSFAAAGLVSAGTLVGVALGAVIQGRLIDRYGPTKPLLGATLLCALTMATLVVAIELHAPAAVLVPLAAGAGLSEPMVPSASRALWTRLVPSGPVRNAALSYEAISMEVFFVLGPGIAGLLIAVPWPGTGMVTGTACMVVGSACFALSPTVRTWGPAPSTRERAAGALASKGMRTLVLAALGFGIVIGFVEVAVPAAATETGHAPLGGLLLSAWSASSVVFGVMYSLRPWPRSMGLRLPVLLATFGLLVALLAAPPALWALAVAMLAAGALITPQSATHSLAIDVVAPKGTEAEAFGWVLTAVMLGLAGGQSVSGYLVEHGGPPASFLAAGGAGLVIATTLWTLRHTMRPPAPAAREGLAATAGLS